MCPTNKCQLYKDAVIKIAETTDLINIEHHINDLETLLRLAEKRRSQLSVKSQIDIIRSKHFSRNLANQEDQTHKDIGFLLDVIDKKVEIA